MEKKESPEAVAMLNLQRTAIEVLAALRRDLRACEVSLAEYYILRALDEAGETGLARHELCARMFWKASDVTRTLDRLERRSLIVRERPARDRRIMLSRISPGGRRRLAAARAIDTRTTTRIMRRLGDRQLRVFVKLLDALNRPDVEG